MESDPVQLPGQSGFQNSRFVIPYFVLMVVFGGLVAAGFWLATRNENDTGLVTVKESTPTLTPSSSGATPSTAAANPTAKPTGQTPVKLLEDFANSPEEYLGYVRFENVYLHGDFNRVDGSRDFSPGVSSEEGKEFPGNKKLKYDVRGSVFVIPEKLGRRLSEVLQSDSKYKVNINCEVTRNYRLYIARIYKVERLSLAGNVLNVYEDK